jgi:hypothetical protein
MMAVEQLPIQPDFSEFFFKHFKDNPGPVHYRMRYGPNAVHDVQFLSSLIHDAHILAVKREGNTLHMTLDRDCWERISKNRQGRISLPACMSVLTATGVLRIEWKPKVDLNCRPMIDYVWLSEAYHIHKADRFSLAIGGFVNDSPWRLLITLDAEDFSLVVRDEPP